MDIVTGTEIIQKITSELRKKNKTIGFIPTMGALHKGHLKLVRESKAKNDVTIVSIFVNPAQFSSTDDLAKYPRSFEKDKRLLKREKIDYLFYPEAKTMYPDGFQTNVITAKLADIFEGK